LFTGFANYSQHLATAKVFPESQSLDKILLEQVHFAMELDASETSKALNRETTNPAFDRKFDFTSYQ
jgi:hypothetical protein